jgi:hypothetical protein
MHPPTPEPTRTVGPLVMSHSPHDNDLVLHTSTYMT